MAFEYRPVVNPYAGTIAELMAREGEPRAHAATAIAAINARAAENIAQANAAAQMQSSNAWSGAVQHIGQTAAQIPQMIQNQKAQAVGLQREQAQIADMQAQQQQRAAEVKKQQAIEQQNATIDKIMQTSMKTDPVTGVMTFDRPTFEQGLVSSGMPHLYLTMADNLDKLDARAAERNKAGTAMLAHSLYGVEQAGYTPEAALTAMAYLKGNGVATSEHLQPAIAALAENPSPETVKGIVEKLGAGLPEFQALRQAGVKNAADLERTKAATAKDQADAGYKAAEVAGTLPPTPAQVEAARTAGITASRQESAQKETERHNRAMEARPVGGAAAAGTDSSHMTPEGLELAATAYRLTKSLPARNAGQNGAIISKAAEQAKAIGQSPVATIQKQAAYAGDAKALAKMQSMSAAAEAFESKADAQSDIILDLSEKVGRTRSPMLNGWILAGKDHVIGDSDTHRLFNAVTTFSAEYAKIMEGSTGSAAGSSDAARKAADRLIAANLSKGTMKDTVALMKREMQLSIQGYDSVIDHITQRMGGQPAPASPAAQAAPAAAPAPATDRVRVKGPNGESGTMPRGTKLPTGWSIQ